MDDDANDPTGPICGECYRAYEFDDQVWATDAAEEAEDPDEDLW